MDLDLSGVRVIVALMSPELFGHERGNIEVYKALRKCGAEVCVGTTEVENGGAVRREIEKLGFEQFPIPFGFQWSKVFFRKHPTLIFRNLHHAWKSNRVFTQKIAEFRPTHIQLGSPLAYSFLSRSISQSRLPLVVRLGDGPPVNSSVQMMIWKRFVQAASKIVAISKYIKLESLAAAPQLIHHKVKVIHNLAPLGEQKAVESSFDENLQHIVYLGQITREKGVFEFVQAAGILLKQRQDLCFHLVGGSPHTNDIHQELLDLGSSLGVSQRVQFHGWVNNARNFLQQAKVHVAPSVWEEPLGNVVMEAKREGTPSVVFPSGGLPEMIDHKINGFICQDKTPNSLAEGIAWVLDNPMATNQTLRQQVAADYEARFGETRFLSAWANIYR